MLRSMNFDTVAGMLSITAIASIVAAQQVVPPSRDQGAQPQVVAIPIGTATVSGVVTTAGGRVVRDARVTLSGGAAVPDAAPPAPIVGPINAGRSGGGEPSASMTVTRSIVTDDRGRFSFAVDSPY